MHKRQADHLSRWNTALATGEANPEPGTAELLAQLGEAAVGAKSCLIRRATLKSQFQQNSRELDAFMAAGKEAFSRLALMAKGRYGPKAEKVIEWGIQPLRPPQVTTEEKVTRFLKKQKPPENGVEPTRAADSQTDSAS